MPFRTPNPAPPAFLRGQRLAQCAGPAAPCRRRRRDCTCCSTGAAIPIGWVRCRTLFLMRMGLPFTLIGVEPTAGRVQRGTTAAVAAVLPPLAIRAGVDASMGAEQDVEPNEEPHDQQQQEQHRAKRHKREKEKKPPPPRPNHFLALQVSQHPAVCAAIAEVHASIADSAPHLKKACVEPASAHLTLGVMALGSEEERACAGAVLAELAVPLAERGILGPVRVELEGLSHFKNQVLYLDVRQDEGLDQLMQLAAAARSHFQAAGLLLEADRPFVPHVTLAKTSKLQGGRGGGSWGRGRGGGRGRHHGQRHGRGHTGGHDWRQERHSKQAQQEREQQDEEAVVMMDCLEGASALTLEAVVIAGDAAAAAANAAAGAAVAAPPAAADVAVDNGVLASASKLPSNSTAAAAAAASPQVEQGQGEQQHQEAQLDWRHIPPEAWAQHVAIAGGTAVLAELQLCAMQGRRQGEYYRVLCSLPLSPASLPDGGSGGGSGAGPSGAANAQSQGSPAMGQEAAAGEAAAGAGGNGGAQPGDGAGLGSCQVA